MSESICEVWTTVPNAEVGHRLMQGVLEKKLAACVSFLPALESAYWWEGKIEHAQEGLLMIKTTVEHVKAVEEWIAANHPYDCPAIVTLPILAGYQDYVSWIRETVSKRS
ncbi:MAG: divalent-cation tolerance protein CutA [Verrucomicrobiae bacterium]|nr:divalent-cation tolerance protein CutA [Verrucomicrobiae bacterium]